MLYCRNLKIRAHRQPNWYYHGICLDVFRTRRDDSQTPSQWAEVLSENDAGALEFVRVDPGAAVDATLVLDTRENGAQQLMDDLWACGLRPTEGSGSAGSLAATERHLADMQKIAFTLLEGSKP